MGQGLRRRYRRSSAIYQAVEQLETRALLSELLGFALDVPATAAAGSTIDVDYVINNAEAGDTPTFHVNFYLSSNPTISGTDVPLGGADLSLAGNSNSGHLTKTVTLPAANDSFWQS